FSFQNNASNAASVDIYVFENNTTTFQSLNGRTPLLTGLPNNGTQTTDYPFISGQYQISVTNAGSKNAQAEVITAFTSSNDGKVQIENNTTGGIRLQLP